MNRSPSLSLPGPYTEAIHDPSCARCVYDWRSAGPPLLHATIDVEPLQFANVTVAVGGPRRRSAALVTQLDASHVYFIEITGVRPEGRRADRDLATFLVNCAIQAIAPLYPSPARVLLFGRVVDREAAPADGSNANAVAQGMKFWERFGFSFHVFDNSVPPQLSGTLSQLHIASGTGAGGEFPSVVPLWQFETRKLYPATGLAPSVPRPSC